MGFATSKALEGFCFFNLKFQKANCIVSQPQIYLELLCINTSEGEIARNILVTGTPRSGTTLVGKVLASPHEVGYIREPFNYWFGMQDLEHDFHYLYRGMNNEEYYMHLVESLIDGQAKFKQLSIRNAENVKRKLGRLMFRSGSHYSYWLAMNDPRVQRLLIKDPMICLSSEYLYQVFDLDVVVMMRHPAAYTASMMRIGYIHDLSDLRSQKPLMKTHLDSLLKGVQIRRLSQVEHIALLWLCLNQVLTEYVNRNPGMILLLHKDVSAKPQQTFKQLYKQLGLKYDDRVKQKVHEYTNSQNPTDPIGNKPHTLYRNSRANINRWHKLLTPKEVKTIREITEPLASKYYPDSSWVMSK